MLFHIRYNCCIVFESGSMAESILENVVPEKIIKMRGPLFHHSSLWSSNRALQKSFISGVVEKTGVVAVTTYARTELQNPDSASLIHKMKQLDELTARHRPAYHTREKNEREEQCPYAYPAWQHTTL